MSVKVKICGIRTLEAAMTGIKAGADFLGFNFVASSKRYTDPLQAKEIISTFSSTVKIVGVFKDEGMGNIKKLIDFLKLDFVQLHGSESPSYGQLTQYAGVIKSLSLPFDFSSKKVSAEMSKYNVDYFLLDREIQGEGIPINGYKIRELSRQYPVFLAGGLTSENVGMAIKIAKPFGVDVAGGIETEGREDLNKIREFIHMAKGIYG